jgi:uncharacterized protein (DUF305 family)
MINAMDDLQTHTAFPTVARPALSIRWLIPLLALLLVTLASGYRLWTTRMPGEGSPEVTFARDMSAHHDQAVEMAMILRDRAVDEELRTIALDVVLTQQAQSGMMQGWLQVWGLPISGSGARMGGQGEMMGMASYADIQALQSLPPAKMETRFLQLMIRHHQGGVMMAEAALNQTDRPEVELLATAIVNAQQSEISAMESMLKSRGAPLPEPVQPMPSHDGEHQ